MTIRGPPDVSLEFAIAHLTKALNSPRSKNVCAVTMGSAALRIEEEIRGCATTTAKMKFVNAYPDLLRAGMHFLTANDGMLSTIDLTRHLGDCECDGSKEGVVELHSIIQHMALNLPQGATQQNTNPGPLLLYTAVNVVSNCIVLSLSRLTQHKYRGGSFQDNGVALQKWPQGPTDLFPNGLEQSYKGLEGWVTDHHALAAQRYWEGYLPVEYSVYQLLAQLVAYHEPFAFSLLNYPKAAILFMGAANYLAEAGKLHKQGSFKAFERVLGSILDFYGAIEEYDHVQFQAAMEDGQALLQNWWLELNDALATRPEWKRLHRRLFKLAVYSAVGFCDMIGQPRPPDPFRDLCVAPKLTEEDHLEDAFTLLVRTRKAGCLNAHCTALATAQQTRLCSKCQVVRYCGEDCQKQAWKSKVHPHKHLCAKIELLKQEVAATEWEKMCKPGFTFAAFQSMVKDKQAAAALVISIGESISKVVVAQKVEKRKGFIEAWKKSPEYALEEAQSRAQMLAFAESTGFLEAANKGPIFMTHFSQSIL